MFMRRYVSRKRNGVAVVSLRPEEATIVEAVVREAARAIEADEVDSEARARLFPSAYLDPTEESAEQDWQSLVHDDLSRERVEALRSLAQDLVNAPTEKGAVVVRLDADRESRWLTALNDVRLLLGTALHVGPDGRIEDTGDGAPELYAWLSGLQEELVELMLDALPETGQDDPP
jgi:hypothetical protein